MDEALQTGASVQGIVATCVVKAIAFGHANGLSPVLAHRVLIETQAMLEEKQASKT
jgi:hypothetical protein